MQIIWRDTDLKTHTINLENAVDVKINGLAIKNEKKSIKISAHDAIRVIPMAANAVIVEEHKS